MNLVTTQAECLTIHERSGEFTSISMLSLFLRTLMSVCLPVEGLVPAFHGSLRA